MAEAAAKLETLSSPGQGGAPPSFGTVVQVLALLALHLPSRAGDGQLLRAWAELYRMAAAQSELAVGPATAHLPHELADRLAGAAESGELGRAAARCAAVMVEALDLGSLARGLRAGGALAGFNFDLTK